MIERLRFYLHELFESHTFILVDARARHGYHARCSCGAFMKRGRGRK